MTEDLDSIGGESSGENDGVNNSLEEGDTSGEKDESSGTLRLRVQHSGKCLDINASSSAEGASIIQHTCNKNISQSWKIVPVNTELVQVISGLSGYCLEVGDASMNDAAPIQQSACKTGRQSQLWRTVKVGSYFHFEAAHSTKCLDVNYRSLDDGASIIQWQCHLQPNQSWQKIIGDQIISADPVKASEPIKIKHASPITCSLPPDVSVEATEEWREDIHGGNHQYANFFTPLMHFNGSSYWVRNDSNYYPHVSKITKGQVETVKLAANYRARKNNHNLFSLGVDQQGYIHIVGDMQNGPNPRTNEYPKEYIGAKILYWKSKKPESVQGGFDFLGTSQSAIPAKSANGIRFFTDNNGVLYSSAAVNAIDFINGHWTGMRGIGLYRYDTVTETWETLGGKPSKTPKSKPQDTMNTVLFWEYGGEGTQGGDYDWFHGFFHSLKFDSTNRLHFATSVITSTDIDDGYNRLIYAVSDDGGYHWKKANGVGIPGLPIRGADSAANQGDAVGQDSGRYNWQTTLVVDKNGHPGIWIPQVDSKEIWWVWDGQTWTNDNSINHHSTLVQTGNIAPGGSMILSRNIEPMKIYCQETFGQEQGVFTLQGFDRLLHVDAYGLLTTGSAYGVASSKKDGRQSIVKITYKPAQ